MPARNAELGLQRPTTELVGDVRVAGSIKSSPAVNVTPRTCVLEPKQGVSQLLSQPRPCLVSPKRICRPLGAWGSLCSAAFGEGFRPIRRRRVNWRLVARRHPSLSRHPIRRYTSHHCVLAVRSYLSWRYVGHPGHQRRIDRVGAISACRPTSPPNGSRSYG